MLAACRVLPRDELRQVGRERRFDRQLAAVDGMREADPVRVQEHPLQPLLGELLVPREIAVLVVAGERKSEMREMDADLMRAPGFELGFEERERRVVRRPRRHATKDRARDTPVAVDAHAPLAVTGDPRLQRQLHAAQRIAPFAAHEHEVALVDLPVAQLRMKRSQRSALLRDQQHARRVAVETVDELEKRRVRARVAQPLDHPEGNAAAAVHGEPGRLVERDQRVVLVEDRRNGERPRERPRPPRLRRGRPDRRNAQFIPAREPSVRPDATPIEPDLAAAQNPVNVAFRDAFQQFLQKIVDSLAVAVLSDYDPIYGILA